MADGRNPVLTMSAFGLLPNAKIGSFLQLSKGLNWNFGLPYFVKTLLQNGRRLAGTREPHLSPRSDIKCLMARHYLDWSLLQSALELAVCCASPILSHTRVQGHPIREAKRTLNELNNNARSGAGALKEKS
jgi:hypothetical protein